MRFPHILLGIIGTLSLFSTPLYAADSISFAIEPGQLVGKRAEIIAAAPEKVIVSGTGDIRDLRFIADSLPSCVLSIDLSEMELRGYVYPTDSKEARAIYSEGEIPASIFAFSPFQSFQLPANTLSIGQMAFAGSQLKSINLSDHTSYLGDYAFAGCKNLKQLTAGHNLKEIGKGCFEGCDALQNVDLSPSRVSDIAARAFAKCPLLSEIKLPPSLTQVGPEAFAFSGIRTINLPASLLPDEFAFSSMTDLEELFLDQTPLSKGIFFNSPRLTSIVNLYGKVPTLAVASSGITDPRATFFAEEIHANAFHSAPLDSIILGHQLLKVGPKAFSGLDRLRAINVLALHGAIPDTSDDAFEGLKPEEINLWVDKEFASEWKSHSEWGKFHIIALDLSSVDQISADSLSTISFYTGKDYLRVSSQTNLVNIAIYSTSGLLLLQTSPQSQDWQTDTSAWKSGVIIADVTDEGGNRSTVRILIK